MPAFLVIGGIVAIGAAIGEVVFAKGLANGASQAEQKVANGAALAIALGGVAMIVYANKK
jgi:hypothetical protein